MDSETAFFWRHLVEFFNEKPTEYADHLERIIPSLPGFEGYLRQ